MDQLNQKVVEFQIIHSESDVTTVTGS